ncbi:MAG: 50S ribosomal protein L28 [Firmicutes bacterium]|nr:50S ribosomal protein L28 [Bacillota bacterium]
MAKCEVCNKSVNFGNKLSVTRSHISKRTSRTFKPNLRTIKTVVNGESKKIKICAKCLRSGKITKA